MNSVLLFEEGGTLNILEEYRNGELVWDPGTVAIANNNLDEVTCMFALRNGDVLEITGVFTGG